MLFRFLQNKKKEAVDETLQAYIDSFKNSYSNNTPIEEIRFVVFDTETTGLDISKDLILSIGAVSVCNNQIDISDRFECYVKQFYAPKQETVAVHGILGRHPAEGGQEGEVLKKFIQYIGSSVLVAHHAAFDVGIINVALQKANWKKLLNKTLDTAFLARRVSHSTYFERPGTFGLDTLCQLYQIPMSDRHTAAGDAFITAILLLKLLARLKKRGVNTLGDLIRNKRIL
jgi:DNA polymerase-3 subunit epsilon